MTCIIWTIVSRTITMFIITELTPLNFSENRIGDLTIIEPWSIEEVMKLYRAEYHQSIDTVLQIKFSAKWENYPRLSLLGEKYEGGYIWQYEAKPQYYGKNTFQEIPYKPAIKFLLIIMYVIPFIATNDQKKIYNFAFYA